MTLPAFYYNGTTINLSTPLAKDDPYVRNAKRQDSYSLSGVRQSAYDYTEEDKEIELTFLTQAERDDLLDMFDDWACEGKTIRFIPDQTAPSIYDTVTILDKQIKFEREAPGVNYWKVKFMIRKEVA